MKRRPCRYLSQKEVLAWILQGVAEEFALLSLEEIRSCIEGRPEISSLQVVPGGTGERIMGLETESRIAGEGSIVYDIRFLASVPKGQRLIRLIINVEAQKDYYPGYQLPTRSIRCYPPGSEEVGRKRFYSRSMECEWTTDWEGRSI